MTDLITKQNSLITFTPEQVDLIKRTVAKEATDDELKLFMYQCERTGLDPFSRQIYFQKHKNYKTGESVVTFITAIDGYRAIAERTGKYAGSDEPIYDDEGKPNKATVTVYKMVGTIRCPFTATARWNEYYPGEKKGFMWNKMPHLMLAKCAEALALRKAFPNQLSGIYTKEEMEQADKSEKQEKQQAIDVTISESSPQQEIGSYEEYKIPFKSSKHCGKTLKEVPIQELEGMVAWVKGKTGNFTPEMAQFHEHASRFLRQEKEADQERTRRNAGIPTINEADAFPP